MTGKLFFIGFLILGLAMLAEPSSASTPQLVIVGDGSANCLPFDSPYIGFVDCDTTGIGGYGVLAVTQGFPSDFHHGIEFWFTHESFNHTLTSESSEFAGVPGTCGTGQIFDHQFTHPDESFLMAFDTLLIPGSCYYYCKIHGPALMRGVVIVLPNHPPSNDSLTPVNISTEPSVVQTFTAGYSDPDGYQNIRDASLALSGSVHSETLRYFPVTKHFFLQGVGGSCSPGQATTLSNAYLTLNCASSSASGSGTNLTVIYNLTPKPPISGAGYRLILGAADYGGANITKDMGYWVINRTPSSGSVTPMNSTTQAGMEQTFISVYSDPDGYQNIAEANFYLSGNGGTHNEWLHYISSVNIFVMMGTNDICNPGQPIAISNGFLALDCGASSVSGSGTTLTITFRVTPLGPSSGINYNIFTGVSDQAGAAHGAFGGTWQIP